MSTQEQLVIAALDAATTALSLDELIEQTGIARGPLYSVLSRLQQRGDALSERSGDGNRKLYARGDGVPMEPQPKRAGRPSMSDDHGGLEAADASADDDADDAEDVNGEAAAAECDFALWRSGVLSVQVGDEILVVPAEDVPVLRAYLNRMLAEAA